jgi:hypothetical protein
MLKMRSAVKIGVPWWKVPLLFVRRAVERYRQEELLEEPEPSF